MSWERGRTRLKGTTRPLGLPTKAGEGVWSSSGSDQTSNMAVTCREVDYLLRRKMVKRRTPRPDKMGVDRRRTASGSRCRAVDRMKGPRAVSAHGQTRV